MRTLGLAVCLASVVWAASATPVLAQLASTETNDVTLVYLQPTQSFIVPHVGRSFENALKTAL